MTPADFDFQQSWDVMAKASGAVTLASHNLTLAVYSQWVHQWQIYSSTCVTRIYQYLRLHHSKNEQNPPTTHARSLAVDTVSKICIFLIECDSLMTRTKLLVIYDKKSVQERGKSSISRKTRCKRCRAEDWARDRRYWCLCSCKSEAWRQIWLSETTTSCVKIFG